MNHKWGPFLGAFVCVVRADRNIECKMVCDRIRGGATGQVGVQSGACIAMIWKANHEGGKDFIEGIYTLEGLEVGVEVEVEEAKQVWKPSIRGRGVGRGETSGKSGQIWGRLRDLGSSKEASTLTQELIMSARGVASVRVWVVSGPGAEEGKSHRKMSRPFEISGAWLRSNPLSGTILKSLPMSGRRRKTSANRW